MMWLSFVDRHPLVSLAFALLACITAISLVHSLMQTIAAIFDRRPYKIERGGGAKSPAWTEARESIAEALNGTRYEWTWVAEDHVAVLLIRRIDKAETKAKETDND